MELLVLAPAGVEGKVYWPQSSNTGRGGSGGIKFKDLAAGGGTESDNGIGFSSSKCGRKPVGNLFAESGKLVF